MTSGVTRPRSGRKSSNVPDWTAEIASRSRLTDIESARGANSQNRRISSSAAATPPPIRYSLVDALALDDAVHRAAGDGFGTAGLAKFHEAHCPPSGSDCPEPDRASHSNTRALLSETRKVGE